MPFAPHGTKRAPLARALAFFVVAKVINFIRPILLVALRETSKAASQLVDKLPFLLLVKRQCYYIYSFSGLHTPYLPYFDISVKRELRINKISLEARSHKKKKGKEIETTINFISNIY